jgi:hypothetical protein
MPKRSQYGQKLITACGAIDELLEYLTPRQLHALLRLRSRVRGKVDPCRDCDLPQLPKELTNLLHI